MVSRVFVPERRGGGKGQGKRDRLPLVGELPAPPQNSPFDNTHSAPPIVTLPGTNSVFRSLPIIKTPVAKHSQQQTGETTPCKTEETACRGPYPIRWRRFVIGRNSRAFY